MSERVEKLILFTLSACPMGRSMHTVLREVLSVRAELDFEIVYVDVDDQTTNRYRVKKNPTTLFLDHRDRELYRIEGFMETSELESLLGEIEAGKLRTAEPQKENRESIETYTVYLYQNEHIVPVERKVVNLTSVKAPRIKAIQQLLSTRLEGMSNPFPSDASLEGVSFQNGAGVVTIRSKHQASEQEMKRMNALLEHTLSVYGVTQIHLEWVAGITL